MLNTIQKKALMSTNKFVNHKTISSAIPKHATVEQITFALFKMNSHTCAMCPTRITKKQYEKHGICNKCKLELMLEKCR